MRWAAASLPCSLHGHRRHDEDRAGRLHGNAHVHRHKLTMIESFFFILGGIVALIFSALIQRKPGDTVWETIIRPLGGGGPPPDGKK